MLCLFSLVLAAPSPRLRGARRGGPCWPSGRAAGGKVGGRRKRGDPGSGKILQKIKKNIYIFYSFSWTSNTFSEPLVLPPVDGDEIPHPHLGDFLHTTNE